MSHDPDYRLMYFTTPEELERAAAFDTHVFSENRVGAAGDETVQPTVDAAFYERLIANGGRAFGLVSEAGHGDSGPKIVTLGAVALRSDPTAAEPGLRHMGTDAAYMLVLATDQRVRGRGLGAKTLQVAIDIARQAGKRRMDTTIHPSNVNSQRTFYNKHFVALGMQSNYYLLDGKDGLRFIVTRDNLANEQWAQENTQPVSMHPSLGSILHAPEEISMTTMEAELNGIFAAAMTAGLCVTGVERAKADPRHIMYSYARFSDPTLLPRIVYPYVTLLEAYQHTQLDREGPWQQLHQLLLRNMDGSPVMNVPFPDIAPTVLVSEVAENKRLFIDWLNDYQKYLMEPVPDSKPPLPYANAFITARDDLYDALLAFTIQENESLRSLLSANLVTEFRRIPGLSSRYAWSMEKCIMQLEEQNKAMYRMLDNAAAAQ